MATLLKQLPPEPGTQLMGLEDFGMSVFPGCTTSIEIPMINGKYNIGLDNDPVLKKEFEEHFNINFDSPQGQEFLENYTIKIDHEIMAFDPKNSIEHKWLLHLLKVNSGMGIIAINDAALDSSPINTFKFKIVDETFELEERVSKKTVKANAYQLLDKYNKPSSNRLILLANYLFPHAGIGENKNLAFDKLEDFINTSYANTQKFIEISNLDPEYIELVVKIKKAINFNIIRMGKDGQYVLNSTDSKLGRTEDEVISFFKILSNKDLLGSNSKDDLPYSITSQLKSFLN